MARSRERWALVVALVFIACGNDRDRLDDALREAGRRPVAGRLSGMTWVRPAPVTRDAGAAAVDAREQRLQAVAADIWRSSSDERLKATAALLAGDAVAAMRQLEALTTAGPVPASTWNDLSVSLIESADTDVAVLCRALAAADRAIDLDPDSHEALFNRALILELLFLRDAAAKAYAAYLRVDGSSLWAAEARTRLRDLERARQMDRRWDDVVATLERADERTIHDVAMTFPQEARVWTETEFLATWGERAIASDEEMATILSTARVIGRTLAGANGDHLPADAVAVIDAAAASPDRARYLRLARAHVMYREARRRYRAREVAEAISRFQEAARLFAASGSPMHLVARYFLANALIDSGDRAAARTIAGELASEAPPRYRALHAEIEWLNAILVGMDGFAERALHSFERAAAMFAHLGEQQFATEMRDRMATVLTSLGRTHDAWQLRRLTFPAAGKSGNVRKLETTLHSAVADALHEKEWGVAHALLTLAAELDGGNVRLRAEAVVWRALAAQRASMNRTARSHMVAAREAVRLLSDVGLREDIENELRLVEALLVRDDDPARSLVLLTEHRSSALRRGRTGRMTQVLIERAHTLRKLNRIEEAMADLRNAIDLVETRRAVIGRKDLRDSFLGTSTTPFDELADLLDSRGDTIGAIAAADQRRARVLLDRIEWPIESAQRSSYENLARDLPPDAALLTYGIYADRLVAYVATARGVDRFSIVVTDAEVERISSHFLTALSNANASEARAQGATLYRMLIEPAISALAGSHSLIVVPDGPLQRIPFAALVAVDKSYLVERFAIRIAPSIRHVIERDAAEPSRSRAVLIVGDPAIDRARFPDLSSLTAAREEAKQISSMYPHSMLLIGDGATKQRITRALPSHDMLHIAAHAVIDQANPRNSRLLFTAGDRDDGTLTTAEIVDLQLGHLQCVVLAACRTAATGEGYGDLRSLSAAFLAAGAREVVATLWSVEDVPTRELSFRFHRAINSGLTTTEAVRVAQISMIRSADAVLANPGSWASMQLYGST